MRITTLLALLIVAAAAPSTGQAQVQVTSSTQYLRYTDFMSDPDDQQDIAQYLRVNARFGEKGNVSVLGYGRIVGELETSIEDRNELADNVTGRLYYLFLDYRDLLPDHLDLRAGRMFVGTGAIPGVVDGAQVFARNLGVTGLGATAFGGRRVFLDNKSELGFDDDYLLGAAAFFETAKFTRFQLSYARDYREGDLGRDAAALDVATTPWAAVGFTGRLKYDLVSERVNELLAAVKLAPVERLILRTELYQSTPTFDRFSFYRFFGVERYTQASLGAEYVFGPPLRVFASYAYERFDGDEDANVVGAGFSASPLTALFLNASYEYRDGYAGRLGGLRTSAGYRLDRATIMAGVDYDDFRRTAARDGTSKRYWAGLDVGFTKMFSAAARIERSETFLYDAAYQGYVAFDVHL